MKMFKPFLKRNGEYVQKPICGVLLRMFMYRSETDTDGVFVTTRPFLHRCNDLEDYHHQLQLLPEMVEVLRRRGFELHYTVDENTIDSSIRRLGTQYWLRITKFEVRRLHSGLADQMLWLQQHPEEDFIYDDALKEIYTFSKEELRAAIYRSQIEANESRPWYMRSGDGVVVFGATGYPSERYLNRDFASPGVDLALTEAQLTLARRLLEMLDRYMQYYNVRPPEQEVFADLGIERLTNETHQQISLGTASREYMDTEVDPFFLAACQLIHQEGKRLFCILARYTREKLNTSTMPYTHIHLAQLSDFPSRDVQEVEYYARPLKVRTLICNSHYMMGRLIGGFPIATMPNTKRMYHITTHNLYPGGLCGLFEVNVHWVDVSDWENITCETILVDDRKAKEVLTFEQMDKLNPKD